MKHFGQPQKNWDKLSTAMDHLS